MGGVFLADFVYKFELGAPSHEGCAGLLATQHYIAALARLEDPIDSGEASAAECLHGVKGLVYCVGALACLEDPTHSGEAAAQSFLGLDGSAGRSA